MSDEKSKKKIWIPLNYSFIKETKLERFLIMNESLFIEKVEETIDDWKIFIDTKSIEIREFKIDDSMKTDFMKPLVPIKLTEDYEICHEYGVELLLKDFVLSALSYLSKEKLKLASWDYFFTQRLEQKVKQFNLFLNEANK